MAVEVERELLYQFVETLGASNPNSEKTGLNELTNNIFLANDQDVKINPHDSLYFSVDNAHTDNIDVSSMLSLESSPFLLIKEPVLILNQLAQGNDIHDSEPHHDHKAEDNNNVQAQPNDQTQEQNNQPPAQSEQQHPSSSEGANPPSAQGQENAGSSSENATENNVQENIVAITKQLLSLQTIEGHTENLSYVPYGLPAEVDSKPENFAIGTFPVTEQKIYLPTLFHENASSSPQESSSSSSSDLPCCTDTVNVFDEFATSSGASLTLDGHTYTFTFEGFCSSGSAELVFTDTVSGVTTTLDIPIIPSDCGIMASCTDPITEIFGNPTASGTGISVFLGNDLARDANGNSYNLVQLPDGEYILQADCSSSSGSGLTAPIVLDLNNQGISLSSAENSDVLLNLNGTTVKTGWIGANDGFLTYGYSGQGPIQNSNFILTEDVPGAKTDLQALAILAGQNGGVLNANSAIWSKLGVWQDANQNGVVDPGEYHTLSQLGIVSMSLTETGSAQSVNGNIINGYLTFTYANGTVGKAADVMLQYEDVIQSNNNSVPGLSNQSTSTVSVSSTSAPTATTTIPSSSAVLPQAHDPTVHSALNAAVEQPHIHHA